MSVFLIFTVSYVFRFFFLCKFFFFFNLWIGRNTQIGPLHSRVNEKDQELVRWGERIC